MQTGVSIKGEGKKVKRPSRCTPSSKEQGRKEKLGNEKILKGTQSQGEIANEEETAHTTITEQVLREEVPGCLT